LTALQINIREPYLDERTPVGDEFFKRSPFRRRGRQCVFRPVVLPAGQRRSGQSLGHQSEPFPVRPRPVEEIIQIARFVFYQPKDPVQNVDQRGGLAVIFGHTQLFVITPFSEVVQPIFAPLFFDQRAAAP